MSVFSVVLLTSVTAFWLLGHLVVRRRLADLRANLPDTYHSAIAVPPEEGKTPRLVALAVDLIRKSHCTDPFEGLSRREKRLALHAHAIEALPGWMSRYAALWLRPGDRKLIGKLRQVSTSRPVAATVSYNAAIRRLLQDRVAQRN